MRILTNKAMLAGAVVLLLSFFLSATLSAGGRASQTSNYMDYSSTVAAGVNATTGTAISPLTILFCHGLYCFVSAGMEDSEKLPWHAQPSVLVVLGFLLLMIFLKDTVPLGPLKKPFDAMDEGIMVGGSLLSLFILLPYLTEMFSPVAEMFVEAAWGWFSASPAWADGELPGGLEETGSFISMISGFLASLAGLVIFTVVWLVSNTINVICLLAPGLAGTFLKCLRLALVGSLYGLAAIHPLLGLAASLLIIFISVVVAGWSFRMTVWGALLAFDLFFRRWRKAPSGNRLAAFSGVALAESKNIAKRTFGVVAMDGGRPVFRYRRFFIFPRAVLLPTPENLVLGRCLSTPLLAAAQDDSSGALLSFRLRDHGHEAFLAEQLNIGTIKDMGIGGKVASARQWLAGLLRSRNLEAELRRA